VLKKEARTMFGKTENYFLEPLKWKVNFNENNYIFNISDWNINRLANDWI